jgi:hypothetical protein
VSFVVQAFFSFCPKGNKPALLRALRVLRGSSFFLFARRATNPPFFVLFVSFVVKSFSLFARPGPVPSDARYRSAKTPV